MSKARRKALEKFPILFGERMGYDKTNLQQERRNAFEKGYHQAEKDLELGWEDMAFIRLAFDAIEANIYLGAIKISPMTKEYYQEVLKRFIENREMPKSMCNGCKYWEVAEKFDLTKFHYCAKFATNNLQTRKAKCGGRYYSTKY